MKSYFIHDRNQKNGPFTFDDLKQRGIEASTLIWFDGLDTWTEATNIQELKEIIIKSPPPLDKNSLIKQSLHKTRKFLESNIVDEIENKIPNKNGKKVFIWSIIILAVVGMFYIGNNIYKKGINTSALGNAVDSIAIIKPTGEAYEDYYENNKMYIQISGEMLNKSSVYSYKDFVIEVKYFTKTNTLVDSIQYTVFQTIKPLDKINFKAELEGETPKGSKYYHLVWKLINANPFIPELIQ
jgi:hypothetical protein